MVMGGRLFTLLGVLGPDVLPNHGGEVDRGDWHGSSSPWEAVTSS